MMRTTSRIAAWFVSVVVVAAGLLAAGPAQAESYVPVSGAGSTWSQNAVDQWRRNVNQYGLTVNFAGTGSSDGRQKFKDGNVDFAVTEIPYGITDQGTGISDPPPTRPFAYMPIVAGGTSFMYNLNIGGNRVTMLRLSGETIAKIFTGVITTWNDVAIKADNPGLAQYLPALKIVPVVRQDGSGTTAQLTTWLSTQYSSLWNDYCGRAGRATPCSTTSYYPTISGSGFVGQTGSLGVSGYVAQDQANGSLTYVEYSYAVNQGFPVAKVKNSAGYYVSPSASNVAVGLMGASINSDLTQNLSGVYNNKDKRAYPLSSYSYMVVPTAVGGSFSEEKGKSLSAFANYFLCEGQQQAEALGFSPLPINLVKNGLAQVKKIPGAVTASIDITKCNNPTFSSDGANTLAKNAAYPGECDNSAQSPAQCDTPTADQVSAGGNTGGTDSGNSGGTDSGNSGGTDSGNSGGTDSGNSGGTDSGNSGGTSAGGADGTTPSAGTDSGVFGNDEGTAAGGSSGGTSGGSDSGLFGGGGSGGGLFSAGVPTSIKGESGWTSSNTMMLLAVVVLIMLAIAPPLVMRRLRSPSVSGMAASGASMQPERRSAIPDTNEPPTTRPEGMPPV
jgi:phosphate ABC transporter phosphate-binding protein